MRIAVLSDTHLAARAEAFAANARAAVAWAASERPDAVVHLGDVTADGVRDPDELVFARRLLSQVGAPLFVTAGNHDVGDCPPGGAGEPAFSSAALARFRDALGPDRWRLRGDGWLVVGLNAQLLGTGGDAEAAQARWLDDTLEEGDERVALLLHKPLFLSTPDQAPDHPRYVPGSARRRLLQALSRRDLRLVASGHVHQSRAVRLDGVLHAWAPSTAFVIPEPVQPVIGEKRCGALLVELGEGEPQVTAVTPPGVAQRSLLDHPEVYPQVAAMRPRP